MIIFIDTSALVKRYAKEKGSEKVAFNRRIFKDTLKLSLKDQLFLPLRTLDVFRVSFADKLNRDKGLDIFVVSDRKFKETLLSIHNYPVLDPGEGDRLIKKVNL